MIRSPAHGSVGGLRRAGKLNLTRIVLAAFLVAAVLPHWHVLAACEPRGARRVRHRAVRHGVPQLIGVALTSTAISLAFALAMSWVLCRTNVRAKGVIAVVMTLPMLIPSLALGSLVFCWLERRHHERAGLDFSLYGFWGIVMGSVLYSFPSAFLLLYDVLKYEDASPYEAADVLGVPKRSQFLRITMPYLRKPLISAVFATFTLLW